MLRWLDAKNIVLDLPKTSLPWVNHVPKLLLCSQLIIKRLIEVLHHKLIQNIILVVLNRKVTYFKYTHVARILILIVIYGSLDLVTCFWLQSYSSDGIKLLGVDFWEVKLSSGRLNDLDGLLFSDVAWNIPKWSPTFHPIFHVSLVGIIRESFKHFSQKLSFQISINENFAKKLWGLSWCLFKIQIFPVLKQFLLDLLKYLLDVLVF